MFSIGQRIVCVKQHSMNILTVGKIYTVKDILYCRKCGKQAVNVGIPGTTNPNIAICSTCRTKENGYGIWWISSDKFAPIITTEEKSESFIEDFINIYEKKI